MDRPLHRWLCPAAFGPFEHPHRAAILERDAQAESGQVGAVAGGVCAQVGGTERGVMLVQHA